MPLYSIKNSITNTSSLSKEKKKGKSGLDLLQFIQLKLFYAEHNRDTIKKKKLMSQLFFCVLLRLLAVNNKYNNKEPGKKLLEN